MDLSGDWSGQQLAEFLAAVSCFPDEAVAVASGVECIAQAVEAEVGAIVRKGRVVSSIGFPRDRVPTKALCRVAAGELRAIDVPGAGRCSTLSIALEEDGPTTLVMARSGEGFAHAEAALVRAMAGVLCLTLRMLRTLEAERSSREKSERQAEENADLLTSLQVRQDLLERLFRIQRSISHRAPITEVLDAITEGAAELLGDDVVGLCLLDPDDPSMLIMVSSRGMGEKLTRSLTRSAIDVGVGGLVTAAGRLVVTHDYPALMHPLEPLVADGLKTAMGAPVFQDGQPIGSLVVASHDADRRYDATQQEMLLAFAEHASLALNDASAVDAMRKAFADAVHQAHHDTLTGLPNRALVLDRLGQALARPRRDPGEIGVLFVDLDRFKAVNDTLGHSVGDEVLVRIGERLQASVRPDDTVGRLAGDEFVVVCEDVDTAELLLIAQRVARAIEAPLSLYGRDAVITASIGVAHVVGGAQPEEVLRDADVAMYRAKQRGRARIEVFDSAIRERLLERLETEHELRRALNRNELVVHYQPIVGATDGRLLGVEALVRWQHPERGVVQPDGFISVAEDTDLILPIGRWVLAEACAQLGAWQAANPDLAHIRVAVNLSARQFTDPEIVSTVAQTLQRAGIAPSSLSLEITESVLMEEVQATAETLRALKELGVNLAIDDFGTGYSSLSYLKRFPVDSLKIDRTFVHGLAVDAQEHAPIPTLVRLPHTPGPEVVGKGV
ncbi:MAG: putative bifunctional diguanylate cyclase/phosphodiesterase, partial [Acidimicrobiales bacterium]